MTTLPVVFGFIDLKFKRKKILIDKIYGRMFHPNCPVILSVDFHR